MDTQIHARNTLSANTETAIKSSAAFNGNMGEETDAGLSRVVDKELMFPRCRTWKNALHVIKKQWDASELAELIAGCVGFAVRAQPKRALLFYKIMLNV